MERRGIGSGYLWISALAVAVVCLGGCGRSTRPKTVPIAGKVTIDGQAPGEGGKLFFTPIEAASGYNKRPASGSFDGEGNYRIMSWEPDDGLVPGRYTVNVMVGDPKASKIPDRYFKSATSGLEIEVPVEDTTLEFNVELRTTSDVDVRTKSNVEVHTN